MPTPSTNPLRVAECGDCGQLFAVYETSGEVVCPSCSARVPLAGLEVAELKIADAAPIEIPAPQPEPPKPAPKLETPPPAAPEPQRAPTVAEWLTQSEPPAPVQAEPAPTPEPSPSLAESLGWQPGSFEVETPAAASPPPAEPAREEPTAPADEFRFDFGATPLSEQPSSTPVAEEAGVGFDAMTDDDPTPQAAEFDWSQASEKKPRRWIGPVTAAAGLLVIAAQAAYFVVTSETPYLAEAGEGRALREEITQPDDATYASDFETPPTPYEPEELPASSEADAEPILDPATQPASFNQPAPSASRYGEPGDEAVLETETPEEEPSEPAEAPVDPFNAPLPTPMPTPTSKPEPIERYGSATLDERYASAPAMADPPSEQPVEQATFTPPADLETPPAIPVETAPYEAPKPRVGLVNVPTYSVDELAASIAAAQPAGEGFVAGSMADPQQVQAMGQHYARLCHLAQTLTLFEPDASDAARLTAELQATDVFKRLFSEGGARADARQIAGPWIGWTGRPHGGVFFAGIPEEVSQQGEVVQYNFRTGDSVTPVVVSERLDVDRYLTAGAREVGILGVVVENPREWIAGYEGDAQRVVWARKTLPLPAPQQP